MTVLDKKDKTVEVNIEGTIGGSWWDDEADDSMNTKEKMRAELKAIAGVKADKIIVNINSYGGDVNHGISIYDMLASHKAEVITRVNGFTASIATVIAMSGDYREMSANSLFLIHKPSLMLLGGYNENEMDQMKEDLQKVDKRIRAIYEKSGVDSDVINDLMEENEGRGKWIDADEALEMGFIHGIDEPMKMAACVNSPELLGKMGISFIPQNKIEMSEETGKLKTMFDDLKNWIEDKLNNGKSEEEEKPLADEVNTKLEEFANTLQSIEVAENAVKELEDMKAAKAELDAEVEKLKAENKNQSEKVKELETKLVKKNAKSTEVDGLEGKEDPDGEIRNEEMKMLNKDLGNLRNQLNEVHN